MPVWLEWLLIGIGAGVGVTALAWMFYETYLQVMDDYPEMRFATTPESPDRAIAFTTEPGVANYYIPPDRVPIIQRVHLSGPNGVFYALLHSGVEPDVLAEMYNFRSRPGFFAILDRFIFLYPIPDAAYTVDVRGVERAHMHCAAVVRDEETAFREYNAKIERSVDLMLDWLSPAQRDSLVKDKFFTVVGSDSKKTYRIYPGMTFNVYELDKEDRPITKLCFQPIGAPFLGDILLAQKLTLETDEATALNVANTHSANRDMLIWNPDNEQLIASRAAAREEKIKTKRLDRKKKLRQITR